MVYSKCLVALDVSIGNPTIAVRIRDPDSLPFKDRSNVTTFNFGFNSLVLVHLPSALHYLVIKALVIHGQFFH